MKIPFNVNFLAAILFFNSIFIFQVLEVSAYTQSNDTIIVRKDSFPAASENQQIPELDPKEIKRSIGGFETTKKQWTQRIALDQINEAVQEAKIFLRKGEDSTEIKKELQEIERQRFIVEKGVEKSNGNLMSDRNLAVSGAILRELLERTFAIRANLKTRGDDLIRLSYTIDSLSSLGEIFSLKDELEGFSTNPRKSTWIAKEVEPTFESIISTIEELENLESLTDEVLIQLQLTYLKIDNERKELNRDFFRKEVSGFNSHLFSTQSLMEIIEISHEKESLALVLYFQIYSGRIFIMICLTLILTFFLHNLKKRILEEQKEKEANSNYLVLKFPFLSALIIIIGLFQFFFPSPPFIFSFLLWTISGISLAIILYRFLAGFWMGFWIVLLIFFVLSSSLNLILIFSKPEQYAILLLSIIGVTYSALLFFSHKKKDLKERRIIYFIIYLGLMQSLSLIFLLYGSLNLSKALLISGYLGVVLGISLLWTVRLINQMLALASTIFNRPDKKLFFINFDKVGDKVPGFFYLLLVIGWILLVGKNFYDFSNFSSYFSDFLNTPRVLGSYSFTINSIVVFVVILAVSFLLSRIVSFFGSEPEINPVNSHKRRKVSLGSWLLLVQIFIISLGLFLAVAATGLPLDKITLVLGALGVGIGLGLQGLFNNLVSGVIIAFENPVKVGDLIEIDGKPGVMKSIGFRSSVVNMFEGSSIIIPNGDLLSNQLVNWTMGKGKKVTFFVGVEYGTDLKRTVGLIMEILIHDQRILKYPVSRVLPYEFADSRIDLEVTFWCHNYLELPFLKGDIISQIDILFKKEGIVIAFPQRDLHIKSGNDQIETFLKNPENPETKV
ncbi:mechanosensitive ion channel domain-containing protein [Aquiflexum balticum]|nr:mechanosensitive ion channel domain-containing protein [Aquiflexum balticum]